MNPLVPYLWAAGAGQILMAAANFALPGKLRYREELARVSPMIRQIFIVHSAYIVLVLVIFGVLSLLFAPELAGGAPLGRFLSASLAVFWLPRVAVQLFYYDRRVKRENRAMHLVFTAAVSFLAVVFSVAALAGGR